MKDNNKYNYVIFGSDWEFYKRAYSDVSKLKNIQYITSSISNKLLRKIRNIHLSESLNRIINLPLKNIWNSIYFHDSFPIKRELCFIVFYDWFVKNHGFVEYLRKKYPTSKIITVFHDLIDAKRMAYTGNCLNIPYLKAICDMVITYDFEEATKYGLTYHSIPYSVNANTPNQNEDLNSDIYFLGQAKNRYFDIIEIFNKLQEYDLKLNFIISGVPVDKRIIKEGITYLDSEVISYDKNLEYIVNTKCILEIIQHNSTGYTSRTLEAIAYNKMLLSNNKYLKEAPFYNPNNIAIINKHLDIPISFIESVKKKSTIQYSFKEELSPIKFLEFIEEHL